MTKLTSIAAAFAATVLIAGAGAAQAAPPTSDIMVVRLGDLNTSSAKGAQAALRRIKRAAETFCGPVGGPELRRHFESKACEKRMTEAAVAELNAPLVTALNTHSRPIKLAQSGSATR